LPPSFCPSQPKNFWIYIYIYIYICDRFLQKWYVSLRILSVNIKIYIYSLYITHWFSQPYGWRWRA
jgi:hypothetical protein